jgi:uncharacterized membrane protein YidH (DUF202 family)
MAFLDNATGHLFSELLKELRSLVSRELQLAKVEMAQKLNLSIRHSIAVTVGAVVAYAGFLVLLASAVVGLGKVVPIWLSALLIGAFLALVGIVIALTALSKLKKMKIQPERTMASVKEDKDWVKREVQEART